MAEQVRFTASLDKDLKDRLEAIGEKNFRKLNGELNVAVAFYLKHAVTQVSFVEQKEVTIIEETTSAVESLEIKKEEEPAPVVEVAPSKDEIKALNKSGIKSRRL